MKPYYYNLFEHMSKEHGLTLTDSEMVEIIEVCKPYCTLELKAQIEEHERGDKMLLQMLGNPPTIAQGISSINPV